MDEDGHHGSQMFCWCIRRYEDFTLEPLFVLSPALLLFILNLGFLSCSVLILNLLVA